MDVPRRGAHWTRPTAVQGEGMDGKNGLGKRNRWTMREERPVLVQRLRQGSLYL